MQTVEHKSPLADPDLTMHSRTVWLLSWVVEAGVATFAALIVAAISVYPGGTFWDHSVRGHSFWQNFLCDLVLTPALGGGANALGSKLATAGMFSLVAALIAFVGVVPALLTDAQQMTRQVKLIVIGACAMITCVPLVPSDRFGALHAAAIFAAGIPVAVALIALVAALAQQRELSRWLRALSLTLCVLVTLSLLLYAAETCFDVAPLRIVPPLARLANLSLIAWLVGLARVARGRSAAKPALGG